MGDTIWLIFKIVLGLNPLGQMSRRRGKSGGCPGKRLLKWRIFPWSTLSTLRIITSCQACRLSYSSFKSLACHRKSISIRFWKEIKTISASSGFFLFCRWADFFLLISILNRKYHKNVTASTSLDKITLGNVTKR